MPKKLRKNLIVLKNKLKVASKFYKNSNLKIRVLHPFTPLSGCLIGPSALCLDL
jgi:hypothetical protein